MKYSFLATAPFGLEGVVAGECKRLGFEAKGENGGARFDGELIDAFRANLLLRCADRVLLVLGENLPVTSFEELYRAVGNIPWEKYIPRDGFIHLKGKCVRSQLMSIRDCQSIAKKAIVDRLCRCYRLFRLPESGVHYPIEAAIVNNRLRLTLDLSGSALSNRGYRTWNAEAPIRETLAAALIELSPYRRGMRFYDPCCGSGTLLIEAAMIASGRPAGLTRPFACEDYAFMPREEMHSLREKLLKDYSGTFPGQIEGSDIDPEVLELCSRHIHQAGYDRKIHVEKRDLRNLQLEGEPGVFLLNPPYGERLMDQKSARKLYTAIGGLYRRHPGWKLCAISADPAFERCFGKKADKKRRLYNGRLECEFFQYL